MHYRFSQDRQDIMKITGSTRIYGIFGWPVGHTLSPALHNAAFERLGINACYVPMPVRPENLRDAIQGVRAMSIAGVNVTVPHKVEAVGMLDEVHGVAAELGAVNVIMNNDGILDGYNTDVEGFRRSLEHAGVTPAGAAVAMIGAGGASRSIVKAMQLAGMKKMYIFNRTRSKAEAIAEEFSTGGAPVEVTDFSDPEVDTIFENCKIVINTTSLGLKAGDPMPLDPGLLQQHHVVIDIIYHPGETELLAAGRKIGAKTVNGYGMLVFQAMEAFRLWTGESPPLEVFWNAGLEEME